MTRKTLKSLAFALMAVFALSSVGEAAPRKVRHRPKHSTRVSSGTTTTIRKKPPVKKARRRQKVDDRQEGCGQAAAVDKTAVA